MSAKKRNIIIIACVIALLPVLFAAFNILTDPFGVFGDPLLDWYAYNETNNPRVAGIAYLERHHEEFDSYIIGACDVAAYSPQELNRYLDARFFNLLVDGSGTEEYCRTARYVLEHYEVQHLVLNLSMEDEAEAAPNRSALTQCEHAAVTGEPMLSFYLKYAFCNPRYGMEKLMARQAAARFADTSGDELRVQNAEDLSSPDKETGAMQGQASAAPLAGAEQCAASVAELRRLCDEKGVRLLVILSPVYAAQWDAWDPSAVAAYKAAICAETDYWDFSVSSVSLNSDYFDDTAHMRKTVGSMILARIFDPSRSDVPKDFGRLVTQQTLSQLPQTPQQSIALAKEKVRVPILMYHHFSQTGAAYSLTAETFRQQLAAMTEAGYQAVSMDELYQFVYHNGILPEKPFCITMDDGYLSNYELAYPILQEYEQCATVFAIGVSVGKDTYKDTGRPITPHFSYEQAVKMMASGYMDVQAHTYDLHQWASYESSAPARTTVAQLPDESEEAYRQLLTADLEQFRAAYRAGTGREVLAYAYPKGVYSELSEAILHENGIPITLTTDTDRHNELVRGLPQSLYALCRLNVDANTSIETILDYLTREGEP